MNQEEIKAQIEKQVKDTIKSTINENFVNQFRGSKDSASVRIRWIDERVSDAMENPIFREFLDEYMPNYRRTVEQILRQFKIAQNEGDIKRIEPSLKSLLRDLDALKRDMRRVDWESLISRAQASSFRQPPNMGSNAERAVKSMIENHFEAIESAFDSLIQLTRDQFDQ